MNGFHADLVGFLPINCDLQAYGSIGVSRLRAHFTRSTISIANISLVGTQDALPVHFAKNQTVMRVGLGLQQMLTCNVGVRAGAIWEKTSKLKNIVAPTNQLFTPTGNTLPNINLKDSFVYSLGVFWQF